MGRLLKRLDHLRQRLEQLAQPLAKEPAAIDFLIFSHQIIPPLATSL
jgi:hypothetical protein